MVTDHESLQAGSAHSVHYLLHLSFREVALAVAAAVALAAAEDMVASSVGSDIMSCLPLDKSVEDTTALRQAEACIAKLQYDPFVNEPSYP